MTTCLHQILGERDHGDRVSVCVCVCVCVHGRGCVLNFDHRKEKATERKYVRWGETCVSD